MNQFTCTSNGSISYLNDTANPVQRPAVVIGNAEICETFCDQTLTQAMNCVRAPGVNRVVLNPDAHLGYGAPVGSVLVSENMLYPGPVGVDIKCSMSLLQTNVPEEDLADRHVRRALMYEITSRIPSGTGYAKPPKAPQIGADVAHEVLVNGADPDVCMRLGIPTEWRSRCEDWQHGDPEELEYHCDPDEIHKFDQKAEQLGSLGGGNHFLEGEITRVRSVGPDNLDLRNRVDECAYRFGLADGHLSFLTHCGSRGIGHALATRQFKAIQAKFDKWAIQYPGGDRELCYAPFDSVEGRNYYNDMSMGANFATVNHLLLNKLTADAVREVFPDAACKLVYFVSHNILRREIVDNKPQFVHRKGATRAFPANHFALRGGPFADTGHPILLPGNPIDGSAVMVALPGSELTCHSINHGAGRRLGRRQAKRELRQRDVNVEFRDANVMFTGTRYPVDESPRAYKDFGQVLASVEEAGLADRVANLDALFVVKDGAKADD